MADNVSADTWKRKDYLSARQTSANVTSYVFEGKEISAEDFIEYSDKIFVYLFQEQESLVEPVKSAQTKPVQAVGVLPTPIQNQMKVLEAIAEKLEKEVDDELKKSVLEWSVTTPNVVNPRYPKNMGSVEKFIKWVEKKK